MHTGRARIGKSHFTNIWKNPAFGSIVRITYTARNLWLFIAHNAHPGHTPPLLLKQNYFSRQAGVINSTQELRFRQCGPPAILIYFFSFFFSTITSLFFVTFDRKRERFSRRQSQKGINLFSLQRLGL